MTHEQFVYWLSGFITCFNDLDSIQVEQIKDAIKKIKANNGLMIMGMSDE